MKWAKVGGGVVGGGPLAGGGGTSGHENKAVMKRAHIFAVSS